MPKRNSKKPLKIIAALIGLAIVLALAFLWSKNNRPANQPQPNNEGINSAPADEAEKAASEKRKQDTGGAENNQTDQSSKKQVEVVITFAGKRGDVIDIRSYVSGIYESGGTCTATFTKDGETFSVKVEAIKDVQYTRCDRFAVPVDDFPSSGNWTVIVEYNSSAAYGKSDSREVSI